MHKMLKLYKYALQHAPYSKLNDATLASLSNLNHLRWRPRWPLKRNTEKLQNHVVLTNLACVVACKWDISIICYK